MKKEYLVVLLIICFFASSAYSSEIKVKPRTFIINVQVDEGCNKDISRKVVTSLAKRITSQLEETQFKHIPDGREAEYLLTVFVLEEKNKTILICQIRQRGTTVQRSDFITQHETQKDNSFEKAFREISFQVKKYFHDERDKLTLLN